MSEAVSRNESQEGKAIWEGVSRAAKDVPEWVQAKITKAASDSAARIANASARKR